MSALEYRYNVWSPPHEVWDVVLDFLGFVHDSKATEAKFFDTWMVLRQTIDDDLTVRIERSLSEEYRAWERRFYVNYMIERTG